MTSLARFVGKRSIYIYTLFGALQSAFWFFALPYICQPLWPILFGRFSPKVAEVLLFAIPGPYFILYAIVVALPPYLLQWEFFEQYKISKDPWPWREGHNDDVNSNCNSNSNSNSSKNVNNKSHDNDLDRGRRTNKFYSQSASKQVRQRRRQQEFWKLFSKSLCIDLANVFLHFPACIYIKTLLLTHHRFVTSFSIDDWPTMYQSAMIVPAMAIFHEFLFYTSHRMMHSHPILYKYHKVHHEYKQNNVLAAQYFLFVDFVLTISGPVVLTTLLFRPHSFTLFQLGLWIFTANLDDHLGYAFPWSAVRWFPFSAGTDAHEFHHSVNKGSYGSKLSVWDRIFRTDEAYERWRSSR